MFIMYVYYLDRSCNYTPTAKSTIYLHFGRSNDVKLRFFLRPPGPTRLGRVDFPRHGALGRLQRAAARSLA